MAGDGGKGGTSRNLDQTPTWAVAGVCAVIIIISIALEKVLHKVGTWLKERHKKALYEALEKVKAELMILGFISLILVFSQYYIADICIPANVADTMLPCRANTKDKAKVEDRRRLLSYERRVLAAKKEPSCPKGHVALISVNGLHQIHILIFFLAVFHVIYSAITMALGRLKIRGWKQWEQETSSHNYEFTNDPSRFRLTHETSFVRAHTSFWTRIPLFFYIGCFLRQFFRSVSKSDYMTLRNGFITVHLAPGSKFNFQKYIKRSLEDDFKTVVGVSPVLWGSFVVFLLLNVNGWQALFWASLVPLIIILAVGTKLQAILTRMALEITERHAVVQGIPLVQGRTNTFGLAGLSWSCILYTLHFFRVGVLFLCSYITLPLYALIAQMGSHMKKSIFDEQKSKALKKWHMAVKKKHGGRAGRSPTRTLGGGSPTSSMGSPFHPTAATLHRFKTTGHSTRFGYEDHDASDLEEPSTPPAPTTSLIIRTADPDPLEHDDHHIDVEHDIDLADHGDEMRNEDDFSFAKPAPQKGG
ncbi:MLO-like protein 10 [Sesamum angolense]|uniref:MLO-like protein n=1 Tax=Sesamum angolense TaxID=2727404 RepID=A0AAE2C5G8_9LAMI|nr:MLO-like protein 10 [Sesamum angolense]